MSIYDFLSVVNVYIVEESWMEKENFFSSFEHYTKKKVNKIFVIFKFGIIKYFYY